MKRFFLLFLLFSSSVYAEQLVFGLYANDNPRELIREYRPLLKQLEQGLTKTLKRPITIKFDIAKTYEEGLSRLINGKVDFSRVGPASFILAREKSPDISVLAVEEVKGKTTFDGIICVHRDSDIKNIQDLKNHSFAFGARNSTVGRYLAQDSLVKSGIRKKDLSYVDYLDRHDKVGLAVAAGQYDAGALKVKTYNKLIKSGKPLRKLYTIPTPTKPWIASSQLSPAMVIALSNALQSMPPKWIKSKQYKPLKNVDEHFKVVISAIKSSRDFEL